jgi:hypothetical protein
MAAKKPNPTFTVRFVKEGLSPETVPWRAVSEAISAVQDLASGRDPLEMRVVPPDKTIGLLNVRRGSAVYSCISHVPDEARQNLRIVGRVLSNSEDGGESGLDVAMVRTLKPIERLSEVAKSLGCRLEVAFANKPKDPVFVVESDDFARLSTRLFLEGETTIIGIVKRVGGQTDMKCALTVPGRRHLLYCDVTGRGTEIIRELGKRLYEEIAAHGTAVWIHSSWHIYKFTIRSFSQPKLGNSAAVVDKLRNAGLSAWDSIGDPETYIQESRT